jgi:tRNA A-37 threonylcarbamoyl transferase component Bud32
MIRVGKVATGAHLRDDGRVMADAPDPLLGTTLGENYILDGVLGEGGMGRVYHARHTRIAAKRFAIKVLHQQYAQHHEALERFKREAEAAALIQSANVVSVFDYGRAPDGRPYLVSDFLVGEELADRLQRDQSLPVGLAVGIVRQVCAGLAVAHANGVTHRDVKPENVFLIGADEDLTVKLLDFGISRFHDSGNKALTQAGIALGTPDYMSPEQAKGKTVDHRADIYAVGVMLYAMLTGVMPFERETPQDTLLALLAEEAPSMRNFDESIPESLEAIVRKAMAKKADDRYSWIVQLTQALAPFDPTAVAGSSPYAAPPAVPIPAAPVPALPSPAAAAPTTVSSPLDVKAGRAWLFITFAFAVPFAAVASVLAIGGVLDAAGVALSATAWLVITIALLLALATPVGLGLRHVATQVWPDPARTHVAGVRSRSVVAASVGGYAATALLLRLLSATVLESPPGAWADAVLAAVMFVAALVGLVVGKSG